MITEETIECEGYTIHLTLNDGLKHRGGELIVHGTLTRSGETQHHSIGKTNQDSYQEWALAAAARVASRLAVPAGRGLDVTDWK